MLGLNGLASVLIARLVIHSCAVHTRTGNLKFNPPCYRGRINGCFLAHPVFEIDTQKYMLIYAAQTARNCLQLISESRYVELSKSISEYRHRGS